MTIREVALYRNNCAFFTRKLLVTAPARAQLFFDKDIIEKVIQTLRVRCSSVDQNTINVVYESEQLGITPKETLYKSEEATGWLPFAKCCIGAKVEVFWVANEKSSGRFEGKLASVNEGLFKKQSSDPSLLTRISPTITIFSEQGFREFQVANVKALRFMDKSTNCKLNNYLLLKHRRSNPANTRKLEIWSPMAMINSEYEVIATHLGKGSEWTSSYQIILTDGTSGAKGAIKRADG